jgi:hypothetical protein
MSTKNRRDEDHGRPKSGRPIGFSFALGMTFTWFGGFFASQTRARSAVPLRRSLANFLLDHGDRRLLRALDWSGRPHPQTITRREYSQFQIPP